LAWPSAFSLGSKFSDQAVGGGMIPAALAASNGGGMIVPPAACLPEGVMFSAKKIRPTPKKITQKSKFRSIG
jgi:hypothetical protein